MRFSTLAALPMFALPFTVESQVCRGSASYRSGPLTLGGFAGMSGDVSTFGVSLGLGKAQGAFVDGSIGTVTVDGVDENATSVSGGIGYEVSLTPTNRASVCPTGGVQYEWIEELGIRVTGLTVGGGVSLGSEVALSPTASLVPFASVSMFRTRVVLDDGIDEVSATETYGALSFGAGLVVNGKFTIRPSVGIPFGLEDADPSFSLSISVNLGVAR